MESRQRPEKLLESIGPRQREGGSPGIYSICSSHPVVLEAAFEQAAEDKSPLLVEATCNQVNQFGGYSGMKPADFAEYIFTMAGRMNFPENLLMIGGDHLGPYVWKDRPAQEAMEKAETLVSDCVRAGYGKIHLDASMPLADDRQEAIPNELSARRAAALCLAAEKAAREMQPEKSPPLYVIGAEVPTPGGSTASEKDVPVSDPREVARFIEVCKNVFSDSGLDEAWKRVIAVVVQPGIDFGENWVATYNHQAASGLSRYHDHLPGSMTYEIHATDYQSPQALEEMARDHFALMKTGPCLTHAFREAVFALAHIEQHLLAGRRGIELSNIREVLCRVMEADPGYWKSHHRADSASDWTVLLGYLDRVRYYWVRPEVKDALARLTANLEGKIPPPLLSQYLPVQYRAAAQGRINYDPAGLIRNKIRDALAPYAAACRPADG